VGNIHITEEKSIAQVVVLEGLLNYVNLHGGIELDLLMVKNHFTVIRKK
jgi:hypothetical protein